MATAPTPAPQKARIDNLRVIWRMAARYPWRIAAALTAMLVAALATLAIPSSFKLIIDRGFAASGGGDIGRWFQYLLMLVVIMAVATAFRFYFVSWLGERVVADLRIAVQANLLRLSPSFFEENRPSEIASRMTSDTTIIEQLVGGTISIATRNLVIGVGGILYLFTLSPKLTGLLVLGIPVVILPIMILGRRVRAVSRASQDRVADVGAMVSEVLGAMKIVQAFGQQDREGQRFSGAVESVLATARRRILLRAIMTAAVIGLIFSAITAVMWQGALDVAAGRMTGGSIAAFVLTGIFVAGAFGALTEVWGDILRGSGAAQRLSELLAETPGIAAPAHPATLPEPARGEIVFTGVEFRYPTRPEVSALVDFSLTVSPGETVALVGPSGAGKTTVFQLVQRFYDPAAGSVAVDGLDVRTVDPEALRRRIAVVPQETVIFAASARDNLRYGRWDADDAALWDAAAAANAADFLRDLPDGLDTFLGEGGARLSGGQRQRVAIARALLRDAPILLLDEATSALDAESERLVQSALERLMRSRTTLVIAHRLATVRAADRIVVMDGGRIVEEGPHGILEQAGGLYARLAGLQFG
ncbi:ABC transporter [Sphingomonas sp. Leaf33]|uniref:ABC transporter transmembrane domain-containing protein n=1 Tax=Sphingomonas sp. Leaf33 TaxID=1736215 RepID=UPI0006FA3946|nr:ABC transporter transmembrane domain-containing protein [Sphingomonas sp. Leaf33]KQN20629.1 ABC transporter [Sphingomonas sp. Leaf33]